MAADQSHNFPHILIVSRRSIRKNKFVNFVAYNPEKGKFIVGLQFHPERMKQPVSQEFDYPGCATVYQEFVKAAIAYQKKVIKNTSSIPKIVILKQPKEEKKRIARSFSLIKEMHASGQWVYYPSKEFGYEARPAKFLESMESANLHQEMSSKFVFLFENSILKKVYFKLSYKLWFCVILLLNVVVIFSC